jgi:DNA transformation protein and related proteins
MTGRDEFLAHVLDLLAPLGTVAARRMFGGHGLYCDGVFFAILLDSTLYLKADERNRAEFEQAGAEIFRYSRQGKRVNLNFYRAPEEAMDAPRLMLPWARSALAAALRARAERPARGRKRIRKAGSR